jgi:hypothetical protein
MGSDDAKKMTKPLWGSPEAFLFQTQAPRRQ